MDKKGFVLMETIVVIVVISVALLTIFSSYNKILSKVRAENKYDTSEYIYITNYISDYLKEVIKSSSPNIYAIYFNCNNNPNDCVQAVTSDIKNYYPYNFQFMPEQVRRELLAFKNKLDLYGVKKIYILTCLNGDNTNNSVCGSNNRGFSGNESKFDAYIIDYIRKLDVRDSDKLIIIEYQREAKDEGTYNSKKDSNGNILYETYIASLEWE